METVSFVILHYKDRETTKRCVRSILDMEDRDGVRVVIVDNDIGEAPGYRRKTMENYAGIPEVTVLQAKEDRGFSYANNLGYAYARERQHASFILVLNNDIEFLQKDFLTRMRDVYLREPCGILAPDVIRAGTGEHQNPMDERIRTVKEAEYTARMNILALRHYSLLYPVLYCQNRLAQARKRRAGERDASRYGSVREGIVPFGALLIFTPRFVEREKKAFWPETRFYYEEYILARRCEKQGYRIVFTPELHALHESGCATRKSFQTEKKRMRFMMEQIAASSTVYLNYLRDTD